MKIAKWKYGNRINRIYDVIEAKESNCHVFRSLRLSICGTPVKYRRRSKIFMAFVTIKKNVKKFMMQKKIAT